MKSRNSLPPHMTIGQVAKVAGIGIETIRFYERKGLLQEPRRRDSGYRQYDSEVIIRIRFIKRAQELGFSLAEIDELLQLRSSPRGTCADVKKRSETKLADIETKIHDLQRLRKSLLKLTTDCRGKGPLAECPILESFGTSESGRSV